MACHICSSQRLAPVIEMGHHPPSDGFLEERALAEAQTLYPLTVVRCEACDLVQLDYVVDDDVLFSDDFLFRTAHNHTLKTHFEDLVAELRSVADLKPGEFVVDIGSNDGTLLANYPDDVDVLGIEPSRPSEIALEEGIPTRRAFFSRELADEIVDQHGRAKIVTCTNVLAHAGDLHSFLDGVDRLLDDDGVFVQESQYLLDLLAQLQYDNIYLEHRRYYSLRSLLNLHERIGLDVVRAERVETQGGSIKTVAARPGVYDPDGSVQRLLDREVEHGIHDPSELDAFAARANANRIELLDTLTTLRSEGNRIVGVGAAAKGVSRLNYCNIGPELVEYVAEINEYKVGMYTPGTHIPVVSEETMLEDDPDYALLLAWNLEDVIVPKLRQCGFEGAFIVPTPSVRFVE